MRPNASTEESTHDLPPFPMAPTLLTVRVPPAFGISLTVKPLGTCLPRYCNLLSSPMISYALILSTPWIVGEYKPVGVDSAIEISALGRRLRIGLLLCSVAGVIVVRKTGHSSIARESALRRNGRKVSRVYCRDTSCCSGVGGSEKIAYCETAGGCIEGGGELNAGGICAFTMGRSEFSAERSRVVE
jgi:hypothetical protein